MLAETFHCASYIFGSILPPFVFLWKTIRFWVFSGVHCIGVKLDYVPILNHCYMYSHIFATWYTIAFFSPLWTLVDISNVIVHSIGIEFQCISFYYNFTENITWILNDQYNFSKPTILKLNIWYYVTGISWDF